MDKLYKIFDKYLKIDILLSKAFQSYISRLKL